VAYSLERTVKDSDLVPISGAQVYVYDQTGALANLVTSGDAPTGNPVTSDSLGYAPVFVAVQGYYTLKYFWGGRLRLIETQALAGSAPIDVVLAEATEQADRAEGFALTLEANASGGFYASVAEGVADAAVEVGEAFNVITGGRHYVAQKTGAATGEVITEYTTTGTVILAGQVNASGYTGADDAAELNAAIAAAAALGNGAFVWLERDYSVASVTNPYGVELRGPGKVLKPITGGNQQLNSYADAPGRLIYGEEYLDRVMQRLKLGASGSSGQIGCFLYGDSTVAGGYMSMTTVDLVKRLFHVRGIGNIAVTNRGVAGTTIADLNVLADLSATTDLAIIKYGINDGGNPDGTRLATFQTTLDAKLTAIRAAANGGRGNLAIVLVGPNATSDTPNGRDERWYEQLRGIYVEAARKHKCAYVDAYAFMRDARGGATVGWDNPFADGRAIHPTDSVGARIWGLVVDAIIPNGWAQWWGTSVHRNVTNTANAPSASAAPSAFLTGIDHARATTGNGWPVDGFVVSFRNPDGGVLQFLYPFAANDTRVLIRTANVGSDTWNRWTGAPEGLTLQNSWVSYGAPYATNPAAYIDHAKTVHVSGVIKSGTTTAGTLLFTLPAGMRPPAEVVCIGAGSTGTVQFSIATSGQVTLRTTGDATLTSLDGIKFLAA
jgi:lysophospholipase L1-like esterase